MSALIEAPVVGAMECGCIRDRYGMTTLCETGAALKAETKEAFRASDDLTIKGGAKVKLCREFAEKRAAYREHIGVGG